jgi:malonyl-CoA/methylmalonyl-CoA synthetase
VTRTLADDLSSWAAHLGCAPDAVDAAQLRATLAEGTLPGAFAAAADAHPAARLRIGAHECRRDELLDRVGRAAGVLADEGVGVGTRILLCAGTSMGMVVTYLAVLHVGATVVLANPAYTAAELDRLVRVSGARLLIGDDGTVHESLGTGIARTTVDAVLERSSGRPFHPAADLDPGDLAILAYTSGTTGEPKGVPLAHGMLLASVRGAMAAWRWSPAEVLVHALPLFHQHGLSGVHATLIAGSDAVVLAKFDPAELVAAVERERATVLFAVPSIYQRLMELDAAALVPLRRLRLATSGSAPLSPVLAEAVADRIGFLPVERYGSTESGLNVSNPYEGERVVGTVGFPLPGCEVRVRDAEGRDLPAGQEGEISLSGPQVFAGYLRDDAATAAAFWPDGWFRTGDLGRLDAAGRLTITGRLKDLIITGGMNVSPVEVEKVLEQVSGVREAAVAGVPSEKWGEEVVAWVVLSALVDTDDLLAHCRDRLAPYKCPKRIHVVDDLPHNAVGKVQRGLLRPVDA